MENPILYRPLFIEFENKVIRQIYETKCIDSPATFFSYESAINFNCWWTWQRTADKRIAVKPICATREQLYSKLGLTGEPLGLDVKSVPVKFVDDRLVIIDDISEFYSGFSFYPADWDDNLEFAIEATKSSDPDAAIALLGLMQSLSNDYYLAAWMIGLEYVLWEILLDNDLRTIHEEKIKLLNILYKKSSGWWELSDRCNKLRFLPALEWEEKLLRNK